MYIYIYPPIFSSYPHSVPIISPVKFHAFLIFRLEIPKNGLSFANRGNPRSNHIWVLRHTGMLHVFFWSWNRWTYEQQHVFWICMNFIEYDAYIILMVFVSCFFFGNNFLFDHTINPFFEVLKSGPSHPHHHRCETHCFARTWRSTRGCWRITRPGWRIRPSSSPAASHQAGTDLPGVHWFFLDILWELWSWEKVGMLTTCK